MNSLFYTNEKKTDFSFIASLIIIIMVAFYFGVDSLKKSNLSEYLKNTGDDLLAKVVNQQDREMLQKNYFEFLEKIENKEISPQEVERLTASLINLKLSNEHLNSDELVIALNSTLKEALVLDSLKFSIEDSDKEKWVILDERVHNIKKKKKGLQNAQGEDRAMNSSGTLEYLIDDSLQIIADENYKEKIVLTHSSEFATEVFVLEQEKLLKWSKDLEEHLSKKREIIRKNIAIQISNEFNSDTITSTVSSSTSKSSSDTINIVGFKSTLSAPIISDSSKTINEK